MSPPLPGEPKITDLALFEWYDWRVLCRLLAERGIDINDPQHDILCRAIRSYASRYLELYRDVDARHPEFTQDRQAIQLLWGDLPGNVRPEGPH